MNYKVNLSIIVTAYNEGKLIDNCLQTLVQQKNSGNYEVIVVDDGSTDYSISIMDRYCSQYEFLNVIHQKNSGSISARFEGVERARGKYITFIDGDDCVSLDYVETINKITYSKANADLYQLNNFLVMPDSKSKIIEKDFLINDSFCDKNEFYELVLTGRTGAVWDKIYKRELFKSSESKLNIFYGEDVYINLLYLRHVNSILMVDTAVYIHYIDSTTSGSKTDKSFNKLKDIDLLFRFVKKERNIINTRTFLKFSTIYLVNIAKITGELINVGVKNKEIDQNVKNMFIVKATLRKVKPKRLSDRFYIYCLERGYYSLISRVNKLREYFIKLRSK